MTAPPAVNCVIDREVLNGHTFPDLTQMGLSFFAPLCGRNRGAFATFPPDGQTYGCIRFPTNLGTQLGIDDTAFPLVDSNAIELAYKNKTLTSAQAVDALDWFVQSVYQSSGSGVSGDVHACDINGLTKLACPDLPQSAFATTPLPHPIRAASLAGVLSPAPWATRGVASLTLRQAQKFYTSTDFRDMAYVGLNTVQIPVSVDKFLNPTPTEDEDSWFDLLDRLVTDASKHSLKVILVLEVPSTITEAKDADSTVMDLGAATTAAATYLDSRDNAAGLILTSGLYIAAARQGSTTLPIFVPAGEGDLASIPLPTPGADPNLYVALDRTHTDGVANVASSTSLDDRLKLYYHETLACQGRALVEYSHCFRGAPAYVFRGFNAAIDDCVHHGNAAQFQNYGQCDRWNERIDSPWWHRHQASFVARQLAGYETGAGWSFDAWKVWKDDEDDENEDGADESVARPDQTYALKNVMAAGLFPSLHGTNSATLKLACLNNPADDFGLGDDTLAPSPGPPPDCGPGWWNFETQQCDYWIPPTPCPTLEPLPTCDEPGAFWSPELGTCDTCPAPLTKTALVHSSGIGAAVGLILGVAAWQLVGRRRREQGYDAVPNVSYNV